VTAAGAGGADGRCGGGGGPPRFRAREGADVALESIGVGSVSRGSVAACVEKRGQDSELPTHIGADVITSRPAPPTPCPLLPQAWSWPREADRAAAVTDSGAVNAFPSYGLLPPKPPAPPSAQGRSWQLTKSLREPGDITSSTFWSNNSQNQGEAKAW